MRPLTLPGCLLAVCLVAGCSTTSTATPGRSPAVAAASQPTATAPATPRPSPDVAACRAMEDYPKFTGASGAHRYVVFLGHQMTRPGTSTRLDNAAQGVRVGVEEVLLGTGTTGQLTRDARRLQAVCTSYGVTGP